MNLLKFLAEIKQLKLQKKLDLLKREYCIYNNIDLIEISYKDINNIGQILSQELLLRKEVYNAS